jgi:hypothetical protein
MNKHRDTETWRKTDTRYKIQDTRYKIQDVKW